MKVNFIEIYNENIHDLLDPKNPDLLDDSYKPKKLSIVESSLSDGVTIPDLTYVKVSNLEHVVEIKKKVQGRRIVSENLNNSQSSRSHVIFEVQIEIYQKNSNICTDGFEDASSSGREKMYSSKKLLRKSSLKFVDLAGSEKINLESKLVVQEGSNINKSLLSLASCINAMSEQTSKVHLRLN